MSPSTLEILDRSLLYSLWVFLGCFLLSLAFISWRLKARRRGLADYYREEFEKRYQEGAGAEEAPPDVPVDLQLSDRLRMAGQALIVSGVAFLACFLILALTPLSPFQHLAAGARDDVPLRLTRLTYERLHEGFTLQGEVWNQSRGEVDSVDAVISVWGPGRELLDRVVVPLSPSSLAPGASASFRLSYTRNSPILQGYGVAFQGADQRPIAHETGFEN